ncbi:MAG: hypothetical protein ACEY3D_06145 [Rickettsia sp.]|uniref:hypothetical protein n=1 Tax=Rickettsia sp. TaxID=789 RepID=UPI00397DE93F
MKMKIHNIENRFLEFSNAGSEYKFPTAPKLLKSTFSQKTENNLIIDTESRLVLLGVPGGVKSEVVPLSDDTTLTGKVADEVTPETA